MIDELETQLTQIIENGIIKNIDHIALRAKVFQSLRLKRVMKITLLGMEIIIDLKIRNTQTLLKEKFSRTYVKLFTQIPSPKDEIINYILFIITYNIHWCLWKNQDYKDLINLRFVYDCYHIIIFYSNGLYVSDAYIKGQIEKIFTSKFLEYERINDQILLQKKLEQKRKYQEKTFLGKKLLFPSLSGDGVNFAKHLNEKLKPPKLTRKDSVKVDSFDENDPQPSSQTKYLLSHLQLNVNQVSPSVKFVLHMNKGQVPFSRAKNLQHNFEKPDEKTKFIGLLNNAPAPVKKEKQKIQTNIIDQFNLRAPAKEYYQKFQKVDPLFKEMLDLNYVLNNHQESLHDLYSTKELAKHDQQITLSDETPSIINQQSQLSQLETNLEEVPEQQQLQQQLTKQDSKLMEGDKIDLALSQIKQAQPLYKPKQKEYKQKYDKYIQQESTDQKIDTIINDLKRKTHISHLTHPHGAKGRHR